VPAPLRALSHDATSTLTAVLLLGLALGTAAAAFSILHATVLAPFPFVDQDRIALIWRTDPKAGVPVVGMWPRRSRRRCCRPFAPRGRRPLPSCGTSEVSFPP
jgi:hypothetical protein